MNNRHSENSPLVSIIIPCYNYAEYVEKAIRSAVNQSYQPTEIIVIDDGSNDGSGKIIKSLQKELSFKHVSQKNQGIVPTRNKGVELAKGEFIIQVDADDTIPENYVSVLMEQAQKNSDVDIFYTRAIDPATGNIVVDPPEFNIEILKCRNFIHASSMFRAASFKKHKYDEALNQLGYEDWDMNLSLCLDGAKAQYVKEVFLNYTQHGVRARSHKVKTSLNGPMAIEYILAKHIKAHSSSMEHLSWLRGNMARLINFNKNASKELTLTEEKLERLQHEFQSLKANHEVTRRELNAIRLSKSYRAGRMLLSVPRGAKKAYGLSRHKLGLIKNRNKLKKKIETAYSIKRLRYDFQRKKAAIYIRSFHHPTSSTFIRLVSPFSHKSLQGVSAMRLMDGEKPAFRKDTDIIVVQRTALRHMEDAVRLVKHARDNNIELFVDTDDAFGELDENHPQYLLQKERVDALNYVIDNADEVWFSTEELQKLYGAKKSKVIRNTLDAKVWPKLNTRLIIQPTKDQPLRMVYMGTATHNEDFDMIIPVLERLHADMPGTFELYIIGVASNLNERPWITQLKPESGLYPDFVQWFSALPQFDIGLSPLVDNTFNRNKSDIKCLDYLGNGVKPIVSDVEAYRNPELDVHIVRVNNSVDEWYVALKKEIEEKHASRAAMPGRAKKGFDYINDYRSTDAPAKQILSSIKEVDKKRRLFR